MSSRHSFSLVPRKLLPQRALLRPIVPRIILRPILPRVILRPILPRVQGKSLLRLGSLLLPLSFSLACSDAAVDSTLAASRSTASAEDIWLSDGQELNGDSASAGAQASGGSEATGGSEPGASGGNAAGGTASTGGVSAAGGTSSTGGANAAGGALGTGASSTGGGNSSGGAEVSSCEDAWRETQDGSVTWYTFDQGTFEIGDVNCSFGIHSYPDRVDGIDNEEFFVAINTEDYDASATCGACVAVTRVETGKSVVATVVDQCPIATNPKCVKGHLDLSKAAFLELGTEVEGYLGARADRDTISWKFVPCQAPELTIRLKEPANPYWNEVVIEGSRYPIAQVELQKGGSWEVLSRTDYNYFRPKNGEMGQPPYRLRVTDINGDQLEEEIGLRMGRQGSSQQLSCAN